MTISDSTKVTTLDWVVIGAGLLAYISSFFPWYRTSVSVLGIERSASVNAWNAGFGAWFSVLLLVVAGGLMVASMIVRQLKLPASRSLITLGLSALAVVTILLRWVTFPDASGGSDDLGNAEVGTLFTASSGAGYGLYLGLIAAIAAMVASLLRFRAEGGSFSLRHPPSEPPTTA
jgi:hypothetical protein